MKDVAERLQNQLGPNLPHADYILLKQVLKTLAEPFINLGRVCLLVLRLGSRACSQNAYCFCCRQWPTECQLNGGKRSGSGQEGSVKRPRLGAWTSSRKEATGILTTSLRRRCCHT